MLVVISPYHLTTREPPAMAALLLAGSAVTLIPVPPSGPGRESLHRAVARSPGYLRFMRSWEWSLPLWKAGVISSAVEGRDPSQDVIEVRERIAHDPALSELRPLVRSALLEDQERSLDELSRDILRAGPDPCFSVPVTAGLDVFGAREGAFVARPEAVSVAQRAEARLAAPLFSIAVPVLLQGGGDLILRAREALAEPLEALRRALVMAARPAPAGEHTHALAAPLRGAAAAYASAFDRALPTLAPRPDEPRAVHGYVALEGIMLPADAVLRASLAAVRTMQPAGVRSREPSSDEAGPSFPGPSRVQAMFIRPLGSGLGRRSR